MRRKKAIMIVMNTLNTDARVQRAAKVLNSNYDLTVIALKDNGIYDYRVIPLELNSKKNYLKYFEFIKKTKQIIKKESWDLIYAHDYYSTAIVSWAKKRYSSSKTVYDSHELIIPDNEGSNSKRDNFFYLMEKQSIKKADLVVCANEDRGELMRRHYKLSTTPISIENISELPISIDNYSEKLLTQCEFITNSEKTTLVYAGVLAKGRRIDRIVHIIENNKNANLLIIGDGPDRERLKKIAEQTIPGRFYFTGVIPYKYLGCILSKCDVGYISYPNDSLNNKYCAPNKIYEYSSVMLPMIAPNNPTISKFFSKYGIGEMNDNLNEAFRKIISNIELYRNNCIEFTKNHPWDKEAKKLLHSVNSLFDV